MMHIAVNIISLNKEQDSKAEVSIFGGLKGFFRHLEQMYVVQLNLE